MASSSHDDPAKITYSRLAFFRRLPASCTEHDDSKIMLLTGPQKQPPVLLNVETCCALRYPRRMWREGMQVVVSREASGDESSRAAAVATPRLPPSCTQHKGLIVGPNCRDARRESPDFSYHPKYREIASK